LVNAYLREVPLYTKELLDNIHIQPRDYTANINHIQVITCNTMETMKVVKSILDGNT